MERSRNERAAATVAGTALALDVLILFLPLHFRGVGEFDTAFPPGYGVRLTVGFLINNFTLPAIILTGLVILWRGNRLIAAGVFLASGLTAITHGVTAPFYALPRLQPIVLLTLRCLAGGLLLIAAWSASRSVSTLPIPPPPTKV
jgi:hypothetical protein